MKLHRPSPAMVVAVIALVVALGGSAYAAAQLTGRDIRDGSLTGADLAPETITGREVARRSLPGSKLVAGSVGRDAVAGGAIEQRHLARRLAERLLAAPAAGPRGETGPQGPQGARGPAGPQGATGTPGLLGVTTRTAQVGPGTNAPAQVTAACEAGEVATGGSFELQVADDVPGPITYLTAGGSFPSDPSGEPVRGGPATAWTATISVLSEERLLVVHVVCAKLAPPEPQPVP